MAGCFQEGMVVKKIAHSSFPLSSYWDAVSYVRKRLEGKAKFCLKNNNFKGKKFSHCENLWPSNFLTAYNSSTFPPSNFQNFQK